METVSTGPEYAVLNDDYPNSTGFDNFSTTTEPYHAQPSYKVETAVFAAKVISVGLIIFLTVVGNIIVITIILSNKHMRTTTYFYLANLAVADITIALISEWTWLVNHLMSVWVFGSAMCKMSALVQGVSVHVSILTLTVVAGDRYFAILHPLKSRVIKRNAGLVIGILWAIALLINIPLLINMKHLTFEWSDGRVTSWCYEFWVTDDGGKEDKTLRAIYTTLMFVLVYVLPLLLMSVAYIRIGCTLKTRSTHGPGVTVGSTMSTQERSKRKVIKMVVVVVSIFALCWLPHHMVNLIVDWVPGLHSQDVSKEVWFLCTWMGYANSALNPFVYCGFNENFRRGFRDVFTGRWCANRRRLSKSEVRKDLQWMSSSCKEVQCLVKVKPNKSICNSHTDGTVVECTSML